jgi:stage V sporulation protein SpoVS
MDQQTLINVLFAVCGALGGWVLKVMHGELRALQAADHNLTDKVQAIEVLVAGQYVTRDALDRSLVAMFAKLDKIEAKLDNKADKE